MASSRDDFIIAIRSAFLKKSTKQKFSLLTLVFLSAFIIILSNLNFKIIKQTRSMINEIIFRSSFVISIPENLIKDTYLNIKEYSFFYKDYIENKRELETLKSENISSEIIKSENKELKNLIEDYTVTTNKILAKVIVDHKSPFLKTVVINKGSSEKVKIGTNIFDKNYLVGRVIEINFKSARVLLLSDLNSSIPVSITPGNIQAIVVGTGENSGQIKYVKGNFIEDIEDQSIVYSSGTGSIFKSGTPIGKINIINENGLKKILVNFYSDFSQLKYVFAEVGEKKKEIDEIVKKSSNQNIPQFSNTEKIKLNLLNDEIEILNESNSKFIEENKELKSEINKLAEKISDLQEKINSQLQSINQKKIDEEELEYLRLNLLYSQNCRKTVFNNGHKVGTKEYKECILKNKKVSND